MIIPAAPYSECRRELLTRIVLRRLLSCKVWVWYTLLMLFGLS